MKIALAIIGIIVVGGVAWFFIADNNSEEPISNTNTTVLNTNTAVLENINTTTKVEEMEYEFTGLLKDVSGGTATGEVQAKYEEGAYSLIATFENLPDPEGTDFYEGWILNDVNNVISTGVATKENGIYINEYGIDQDLSDYNFYVLTLEPDDGDPAPAEHILEGDYSR